MAKSSVKFKDCEAQFTQLRADIAARKFAPIYLLMGEESYFIDALCEQLSTTILSEAERSFNQIVLYGRDTDGGTVASYCRQVPMMGAYEVIIVKEAQHLAKPELLCSYTTKPQASTILIICHKEKSADRRQQLYKSCLTNGVVFESVRPRDYEIKGWLGGFVASKGAQIEPQSVDLLVNHIGFDIARISNELEKLIISMPEGKRSISPVEIEQYIGISREYNNYELCAAVTRHDVNRALNIADHLSRNPKEYPLLLTIKVLFDSFREIFIINYLRWRTKYKGDAFPADAELLSILKSRNAFALRDLKQYSSTWNNRKVFNILGLLREYDGKSKGIDAGSTSNGELLRELLLKIFME